MSITYSHTGNVHRATEGGIAAAAVAAKSCPATSPQRGEDGAAVVAPLRRGKASETIASERQLRSSTARVHVRNIINKIKATTEQMLPLVRLRTAELTASDCAEINKNNKDILQTGTSMTGTYNMGSLSDFTAGSVVRKKHSEARVKPFSRATRPQHGRDTIMDKAIAGMQPRWSWPRGAGSRSQTVQTPPAYEVPVGGLVKRVFDVTIASTTLVLMAPTMILIALLIMITMGRPVFFVQQRIGFNRRLFGCLKFRTMTVKGGDWLANYLAENPDAARAWSETQKLKHDPRVTWLGRLLRKSSLDELPQLLNVLRGEMSCIGPRPVIEDELKRYGDHETDYAKAKPGLTGMWQVNGRSNTSYAHRVNCDRYYVRRWSVALDFGILFKTIPAIIKVDETA
jgi:exopolysaccharide production protein ExoY